MPTLNRVRRIIHEIIEKRRREGGKEDKVQLVIHPRLFKDFSAIKNIEKTIILVVKKSLKEYDADEKSKQDTFAK